jgi:hypothetical protein
MKRLFAIFAVLLVALFITDNWTIKISIPKKAPITVPVKPSPTPHVATKKISDRINHVWQWLKSRSNRDGQRILIYVALLATLAGAVLRRSGAKAAYVGIAALLLVVLAEPIFVGFLGFNYYVRTSNWQYTNFLIIGALEATLLALGYASTPQSTG